jgi:hypothetical protein
LKVGTLVDLPLVLDLSAGPRETELGSVEPVVNVIMVLNHSSVLVATLGFFFPELLLGLSALDQHVEVTLLDSGTTPLLLREIVDLTLTLTVVFFLRSLFSTVHFLLQFAESEHWFSLLSTVQFFEKL